MNGGAPQQCTGGRTSVWWWQRYRSWARQHRDALWLLDASLSRLLLAQLWTPTPSSPATATAARTPPTKNNNDGALMSSWRHAAWGLLELHRLLLEFAEEQDHRDRDGDSGDDDDGAACLFGASVEIIAGGRQRAPPSQQQQQSFVKAGTLRWTLTALQSLGPVALELAASSSSSSYDADNNQHPQQQQQQERQIKVRRYLERARFLLRLTLLVKYWRRLLQSQQQQQQQHSRQRSQRQDPSVLVPPGLLLNGGRRLAHHAAVPPPSSLEQERYRLERQNYVGRRTGRRLTTRGATTTASTQTTRTTTTTTSTQQFEFARVVLGELLYIARPLVQAEREPSRKSWLLCLAMDVASLLSLRQPEQQPQKNDYYCASPCTSSNPATAAEWNRRRVRLLLHLLRAPVWDRATRPAVERVGAVARRLPLAGGLLHNYLWDCIYYWKEYKAEEG